MTRRSTARNALLGQAQKIADSRQRVALSIHASIPLPEDADPILSGSLPEYITREIDADVRAWIRGHAKSGGLIVLVGEAAAGKTRCLFEALRTTVPDWPMPDVETGAQLNALVRNGVDLSRTVLWLDELQNFFADEVLTAASVRQLILGRHGPVLLAATIRGEELDRLLRATHEAAAAEVSGAAPYAQEYDQARQVVRMLARWSPRGGVAERAIRFHLDSRLTTDELARARELAAIDPRIASALHGAEGGRVTATLAGAPELIDRWTLDTAGNPNGQAVITAAVVARRCGHPEPLPRSVLEELALRHLAEQGGAPPAVEWLSAALEWAESPIEGRIRALRKSVTQPGVLDGFRVSDVLVQHSYAGAAHLVDVLLNRDDIWGALLEHANRSTLASIGRAAEDMGKREIALRAWREGVANDDLWAMALLGSFHARHGDLRQGAEWLRQAADRGHLPAMSSLALCLEEMRAFAESESWLRRAADQGYTPAMVNLGLRLFAGGHQEEGESWYRQAADLGETDAMANLGYQFAKRGDIDQAEEWNRRAAVLGHPGAMENLAVLLRERDESQQALEWYRQGAERALNLLEELPVYFDPWPGESLDQGVSNVVLGLADMLIEQDGSAQASEEAERWFTLIAERGDARAAAALAGLCAARGDMDRSRIWRRKAAELANENLTRNGASLLAAYGEPGVRCHVDIMMNHAARLAEEGDGRGSEEWHAIATRHAVPR
ncbi:tetratricopeptide repeat protein [Streptomyces shaanxiensis]